MKDRLSIAMAARRMSKMKHMSDGGRVKEACAKMSKGGLVKKLMLERKGYAAGGLVEEDDFLSSDADDSEEVLEMNEHYPDEYEERMDEGANEARRKARIKSILSR